MSDPVYRDRRSVIAGVAERWARQYGPKAAPDKHAIHAKLRALDPLTATREEVDGVIGNKSWTTLTCDGCGEDADETVDVGAAPDYESSTATLCRPCVQRALAAFPEAHR